VNSPYILGEILKIEKIDLLCNDFIFLSDYDIPP
jgi:hypothetical protein